MSLCTLTGLGFLELNDPTFAQDAHSDTHQGMPSADTAVRSTSSPSPALPPASTSASTPAPGPSATPKPTTAEAPTEAPAEVAVVPDRIIRIDVRSNPSGIPQFNPPKVEVTAGQQVEVILRNDEAATSGITHNWVLIKPGSESAVAALGKQAGVDPDAVTYSPSILAATRTTRPGNEGIIDFVAPDQAGNYPYISLVGDQRKVLKGLLVVKPVGKAIEQKTG